jgi:hypothetical protein
MSVINSDSVRSGASGAVTAAYIIEQSCRFNDDDSPKLTRTPRIAGNTQVGTISVWLKRGNLGSIQQIFNSGAGDEIGFNASDKLIFTNGPASSYITTQVFRDPTAWGHLVIGWDTIQATAAQRVRFYWNGVEITAFGTETNPAHGDYFTINSKVLHTIGANEGGTEEYDGYMADFHLIDGAQLAASDFGETDSNGIWVPIEYAATNVTYATDIKDQTYTQSSYYSGRQGSNAFDEDISTRWNSSGSTSSAEWVQVEYVTAQQVDYMVGNLGDATRGAEDWTLKASNTGSFGGEETTLITQTGAAQWGAVESRRYTFTNASSYKYYRIEITESSTEPEYREIYSLTLGLRGTGYGTNGYRLDFADSSNFGLDVKSTPTAITEEFADSSVDPTAATSHTFSGHAIGTAGASRIVVVGAVAEGREATSITSVTIGGTTATAVATKTKSTTNIGFYTLALALGTTADIIVTANTTSGRWGIGVWAIYGATDGIFHSDSDDGTGLTTTLNVPKLGWAASVAGGVSGSPLAWTGLTEDYDEVLSGVEFHSGASDAFASASMARTVSNDESGHANNAILSVSWAADGDNSFYQSGLATNDQVTDSPTDDADNDIGNYCTWNPLNKNSTSTLSDGNLVNTTSGNYGEVVGTIGASGSDKKYYEVTATTMGGDSHTVGWVESLYRAQNDSRASSTSNQMVNWSGGNSSIDHYYQDGSLIANPGFGDGFGAGDVIQLAIDVAGGKAWFGLNNTWDGDPAAGTGAGFTIETNLTWLPFCDDNASANNCTWTANFGQSAFAHAAPAGFSALATHTMAAPAIKDPSKYFQANEFTSTNAELERTLTDAAGDAVSPDLLIFKDRDAATEFPVIDTTRGATYEVTLDGVLLSLAVAQGVKSFNASGHTLGTDASYNPAGSHTMAEYAWVEGATPGLSIQEYTATVANLNVAHSLGEIPEIAFFWPASGPTAHGNRFSYPPLMTNNQSQALYNQYNIGAESASWNGSHTSSNLTIGAGACANTSGNTYISYAFASVEGFSKAFHFEGNGNVDGSFVHLGFRLAWLLLKSADSTSSGWIFDKNGLGYNVDNNGLEVDIPAAQITTDMLDITSNGFKLRISTDPNVAETYIGLAFAEFPFGGDGVAQARAR